MISLLYEPLPCCIHADGREIPVLTDFRAWLQFLGLAGDKVLTAEDKAAALGWWLAEPAPVTREVVRGLCDFCKAAALEPDPDEDVPEPEEPEFCPPTWDWQIDGKYVLGDFRRYYGIDLLRVDYLHWWEFRALFAALPAESQSMHRIDIRGMDLSKIKDKDTRQHYRDMQRRIALPFEMDDEAIGAAFATMM